MVATINTKKLLNSLKFIQKGIDKTNINTELALFNVTFNQDKLIIKSKNGTFDLKQELQLQSSVEGHQTILVDGSLVKLLSNIKSVNVSLTIDEYNLIIQPIERKTLFNKDKQSTEKFSLCISKKDFDSKEDVTLKNTLNLQQSEFKSKLNSVIPFASNDTIKPVFNGVFLGEQDDKMVMVTTDARRIGKADTSLEVTKDLSIILPLITAKLIADTLSTGDLTVMYDDLFAIFLLNDIRITTRIIEGQFPNYKQVIPKEFSHNIEINKKAFLDVISRAIVFTRESAYKLIFTFENNNLIVEASTPDLGNFTETLECISDNKEQIILGVNGIFILDAIKEIKYDMFSCKITGAMSPLLFQAVNNESFQTVIMPIQIKKQD